MKTIGVIIIKENITFSKRQKKIKYTLVTKINKFGFCLTHHISIFVKLISPGNVPQDEFFYYSFLKFFWWFWKIFIPNVRKKKVIFMVKYQKMLVYI